MDFNYPDKIGKLPPDKRLYFYELLAHNLTIAIRSIWSEYDLSDSEKLSRISLVNEIMHRVTAKVYTLRFNLHEWTEEDSWAMIRSYIADNNDIESEVLAAINHSYNCVGHKEGEGTDGQNDA